MISVKMTKSAKEYQPKAVSVFSSRQIIFIFIVVLYSIPIYMLLDLMGMDVISKVTTLGITAIPGIIFGWMPSAQIKPEKLLLKLILRNPPKRMIVEQETARKKYGRIKRYKTYKGYRR